jgi:hypothetical protein
MADVFAEHVGAQNVLAQMGRKTAAYNALSQAYGGAAGDPEAAYRLAAAKEEPANAASTRASQAASAGLATAQTGEVAANAEALRAQREATTAKAERDNTAAIEKDKRDAGLRILAVARAQVDPATDAVTEGAFDSLIGPRLADLGVTDPAQQQALRKVLTSPGGAKQLDNIEKGYGGGTEKYAGSVQQVINPDGSVSLYQPSLNDGPGRTIGLNVGATTPTVQNSETAAQRAADTAAHNKALEDLASGRLAVADFVAQERARANVANEALRGRGLDISQERVTNAADPALQGDLAGAKAKGSTVGKGEGGKVVADLPLSNTERAKADQQLAATQQTYKVAYDKIAKAKAETGFWSAGPMSNLPDFANPAAAKLRGDITTLTGKVLIDTVAELKTLSKNGSTAFGQLSNQEGDKLQSRYGALIQAQRPEDLKKALDDFNAELHASQARVEKAYKADLAARTKAAPAAAPANGGWGNFRQAGQ